MGMSWGLGDGQEVNTHTHTHTLWVVLHSVCLLCIFFYLLQDLETSDPVT